jgi:activator of 2-hydroxyglutaryl-CoA dehydratase
MYYLGIDVGSVSTDLVIMNENRKILTQLYLKTRGNPIEAVKEGLRQLGEQYRSDEIIGVGATGSGRSLAAAVTGADVVKNEITAHGFLDRQAERLGLEVKELGGYALRSESPVRIAGRCAVFAESDIIHKQQLGCTMEDIIAGMSKALVRNYLSNVAKGKEMIPKVCFQGGVASNSGIHRALEEALETEILVPEYHKVMGAYGSAVLAQELMEEGNEKTRFKGFETGLEEIRTETFECADCSNHCEVVILRSGERQIGCFSDRCGKYQTN